MKIKPRHLTAVTVSSLIAMSILVAGLTFGPKHIPVAQRTTGDPELAGHLVQHAPKGAHNLAAAIVDSNGAVKFAGLGADENTEFEIGSVSKTFTAELLRQAVERGEVTLDTTVGEILDDADMSTSDITLKELATHTSGLPRILGISAFAVAISMQRKPNPYDGFTTQRILDEARTATLADRGTYNYSNFGMALLGHLLARRAGTTYAQLAQERIFTPLGMNSTYVMTPETTPANAPRGLDITGHPTAAWDDEGYGPAGGIRSTAADMTRFMKHLLAQGLPDYTWVHEQDVAWHNGMTGGFTSMLVVDPQNHNASFVANDSNVAIDALGMELPR